MTKSDSGAPFQSGNPRVRSAPNLFVPAVAVAFVLVAFLATAHLGLNLSDEGYLWYGAVQTSRGFVPIRDFDAYDPGRYLWTAPWMAAFGEKILPLRIAGACFYAIGLALGLSALARRTGARRVVVILTGALLAVWMFPAHKLFESAIAMAAIYASVLLIERGTLRRHLAAGVFVGLSAFFGRNLGLYCLLALAVVLVVLHRRDRGGAWLRPVGAWILGIVAGYSPMLLMLLFVRGFAASVMRSFEWMFRLKTTNLSIPVPWPWTLDWSSMNGPVAVRAVGTGFLFVLVPLAYLALAGFVWVRLRRGEPLANLATVIGSVAIGVPFLHHIFARAALVHLAQGIQPCMIGIAAAASLPSLRPPRRVWTWFAGVLLLLSVLAVGAWRLERRAEERFSVRIFGEELRVDSDTASLLRGVSQIDQTVIPAGDDVLVMPRWPGIYVLMRRRAPLPEIYRTLPEPADVQERMIRDLEAHRVRFAIVQDLPMDGREDRRFSHTHPLLWRYLNQRFAVDGQRPLPAGFALWSRRP